MRESTHHAPKDREAVTKCRLPARGVNRGKHQSCERNKLSMNGIAPHTLNLNSTGSFVLIRGYRLRSGSLVAFAFMRGSNIRKLQIIGIEESHSA